MSIKPITNQSRQSVISFFKEHWGSAKMIISSGTFDCAQLDGYMYEEDEMILGLLTYVVHEDALEVISLDSIREGQGIGTQLMHEAELLAKEKGLTKITLITTNDNLAALKFYQKRGYRIVEVFPNAVTEARKVKPTIPLIGNDDIPLHDELLLEKHLTEFHVGVRQI